MLCYLLKPPVIQVHSRMAKSTSSYISELVNHMKGFSVMDEDTLFDLAIEHVTDSAAEKLGFTQGIKQQ